MADTSQMFARLLPIDIKFFNGESPSPQKMNGIFNYVHAAFYILESFLGNGIDYRMPIGDAKNRKMLFNLSQVLGNTGKLYKPVNQMVLLEYIHRTFGIVNKNLGPQDVLHTSHTLYNATTELLTIRDTLNIPIALETYGKPYYIGFYYTGRGSISVSGGNVGQSQTIALPDKAYRTFFYTRPQMDYIDYITLAPVLDGYGNPFPFDIEAMFLVNGDDVLAESNRVFELDASNNHVSEIDPAHYIEVLQAYNTGYAIPLDNIPQGQEVPTFWTIKTPCKWAMEDACTHATCTYCIGNVYDIDVNNPGLDKIGAPICGGLNNVRDAIHPFLVPKDKRTDTLGGPIEYVETDFQSNPQSQTYTIQSPLLMKDIPYMMKYKPFMAHNLGVGLALTKNESVVYDISSRTNPVRYNVPIYSAGRPDIVFVFDTNKELAAGSSTNIQILGGPYTMTEFIEDLIVAMNMERNPTPAVYAD